MLEWGLFEVLGHKIAPMKSGHFVGFSKNARIGKPGILWGFRCYIPGFNKFSRIYGSEVSFNEHPGGFLEGNTDRGARIKNKYILKSKMFFF